LKVSRRDLGHQFVSGYSDPADKIKTSGEIALQLESRVTTRPEQTG
jgi:hypothetical protein